MFQVIDIENFKLEIFIFVIINRCFILYYHRMMYFYKYLTWILNKDLIIWRKKSLICVWTMNPWWPFANPREWDPKVTCPLRKCLPFVCVGGPLIRHHLRAADQKMLKKLIFAPQMVDSFLACPSLLCIRPWHHSRWLGLTVTTLQVGMDYIVS